MSPLPCPGTASRGTPERSAKWAKKERSGTYSPKGTRCTFSNTPTTRPSGPQPTISLRNAVVPDRRRHPDEQRRVQPAGQARAGPPPRASRPGGRRGRPRPRARGPGRAAGWCVTRVGGGQLGRRRPMRARSPPCSRRAGRPPWTRAACTVPPGGRRRAPRRRPRPGRPGRRRPRAPRRPPVGAAGRARSPGGQRGQGHAAGVDAGGHEQGTAQAGQLEERAVGLAEEDAAERAAHRRARSCAAASASVQAPTKAGRTAAVGRGAGGRGGEEQRLDQDERPARRTS